MRIAVSVDMEGVSQLKSVNELWGALPEYWETGKPATEADVHAACEGLLAGGATELVVLDNHGGNRVNVSAEALPAGARLETWRDFDLRDHAIDATFQVGYHARGGVDGFLSHSYVPGLRLRLDGERISESHGRTWASAVPLLGITGNDLHEATLGSLAGTPFLVTQTTISRSAMQPAWESPEDGYEAIRAFAELCVQNAARAPQPSPPADALFEASLPNGVEVVAQLEAAGWERQGEVEFAARLRTWDDARPLIAAAMDAAMAPFLPYWLGSFDSATDAAAADPERVAELRLIFEAWARESHPEWYTTSVDALPAGVRERLTPSQRGRLSGARSPL